VVSFNNNLQELYIKKTSETFQLSVIGGILSKCIVNPDMGLPNARIRLRFKFLLVTGCWTDNSVKYSQRTPLKGILID
jgi:hypothetical protein